MSSIIKQAFVSLLDQKKTIEVVNINSDKIINNNTKNEQKNENYEKVNDDENKEIEVETEDYILSASAIHIDSIIEDAKKQAEEIIEKSKTAAIDIEKNANLKGYEEGYNAGIIKAQKEAQLLKQQLEDDKEELINNLQPKISKIIQTLVTNMVGIQCFEQGVILFLIKVGLQEIDLNNDILIKVSQEDYEEVVNNKQFITNNLSQKVNIEVLQDIKLNKNDCIIETSLGIIDCSLNARMEGLLKQLQLIERSFYNTGD